MVRFGNWMAVFAALTALWTMAGCGAKDAARTADGAGQAAVDQKAGAPGSGPELTAVTLQLNWFPEVEHGGYFAAVAEGYYREAGLDVKILPGGPDTPVLQQVARRAATFGVVNADNMLFGRAQQVPVVALMAPLQNSPRCLIVHESSGIRDFAELKNMTIAMSASAAFSQFLRFKLPLEGVKIVPYAGSVAQFLLNPNYAQQGYVFSEPFVARKEGGDPRVLMLSELGFNPYTSLLFTHDQQRKANPEVVRKMVTASVRGWQRYLESPEAANRMIHQMNPEMDFDILEFGADKLKPLVSDATSQREGIGTMSKARWQTLADQLVESKQLKPAEVDVNGAFTTEFLPPAPDAPK